MRKLAAILILGLLTQSVFAQFIRTYGTPNQDFGSSLTDVTRFEPGYVLASRGGTIPYQFKTNEDGDLKWSFEYFHPEAALSLGSIIEERLDNTAVHYATAGSFRDLATGNLDALLLLTDPKGSVIGAHRFGGSRFESFSDIINIKDEHGKPGLLMLGRLDQNASSPRNSSLYIVQTDISGNFQKATVIESLEDLTPVQTIQTADGGYAIVAVSQESCTPSGVNRSTLVVKLKADFSLQWSKTFSNFIDFSSNTVAHGLTEDRDGNLIITGQVFLFEPRGDSDLFLLKLTPSGNLIWMKAYGDSRDLEIGLKVLAGFIQPNSYGYSIAGSKQFQAMLFQTDINGKPIRGSLYQSLATTTIPRSTDLRDFIFNQQDNVFAFFGTDSQPSTGRETYLVETDLLGNSNSICQVNTILEERDLNPCSITIGSQYFVDDHQPTIIQEKEIQLVELACTPLSPRSSETIHEDQQPEELIVYPNPVTDKLMITIPQGFEQGQLQIISLTGKQLIKQPLRGITEVELDVNHFPKGLLLLEITSMKGEKISMKVQKE